MDKTTLGLIGVLSSLGALPTAPAQAATQAVPPAASYADLLEPIPNAVERLKLADAQADDGGAQLIEAQYVYQHHHHRYHRRYRRHYYHHHHHSHY